MGQFEKALAASLDEMRVDPNSIYSYQDLADAYFNLNRLDEAKAIAEQGLAKVPDAIGSHPQLMEMAYMRGDTAEFERHLAWAKGRPDEQFLLLDKSSLLFNQGKLKAYAQSMRDAQAVAQKFGNAEFSAAIAAYSALGSSLVSDCASAKALASASIQQSPSGFNLQPAATALARCGEAAKASQAIDVFLKQYPSDTLLNLIRKPAVLALMAIHEGKFGIRVLESARRAEIGGAGPAPAWLFTPVVSPISGKKTANAALVPQITERLSLFLRSYFRSLPVRTGPRLCLAGRFGQSPHRLSRFPRRLERRRP
jgi:tetratricopeptide (TPR) repeat protein